MVTLDDGPQDLPGRSVGGRARRPLPTPGETPGRLVVVDDDVGGPHLGAVSPVGGGRLLPPPRPPPVRRVEGTDETRDVAQGTAPDIDATFGPHLLDALRRVVGLEDTAGETDDEEEEAQGSAESTRRLLQHTRDPGHRRPLVVPRLPRLPSPPRLSPGWSTFFLVTCECPDTLTTGPPDTTFDPGGPLLPHRPHSRSPAKERVRSSLNLTARPRATPNPRLICRSEGFPYARFRVES